jgi:hypothetical protein
VLSVRRVILYTDGVAVMMRVFGFFARESAYLAGVLLHDCVLKYQEARYSVNRFWTLPGCCSPAAASEI